MNIRIVSTVGSDEENRLAPGLLTVLKSILDLMPIAYAIRIETADAKLYEASNSHGGGEPPRAKLTAPKLPEA